MDSHNDWRASTLLRSLERGTEGFEIFIIAGEYIGDMFVFRSQGGNGRQSYMRGSRLGGGGGFALKYNIQIQHTHAAEGVRAI